MNNVERLEEIINGSLIEKDGFPLPSIIEINVIDSCNRACPFCPRSNPEIAPNNPTYMDWKLIEKIFCEMNDMNFKGLLTFSGFCEPFMYKNLTMAVALLSMACKVDVITNGDYLNKQRVDALFNAGLNRLLVSVYEEKRLAPIQEVLKGYEDKIDIRIRFNGFKTTNRGGTLDDGKTDASSMPCHYLAYHLFIDWNGDVLLCPQDWNRRVRFGNINHNTLFEIWTSPNMTKFRKDLFTGRTKPPCIKCDAQGTIHGAAHRDLWLKS